jgi:hypothetical protein
MRRPILVRLALVVLVLVVGGIVHVLVDTEPARQVTMTPAPSSEPPGLTDGIYEVGTEIQPGTYSTIVDAGHACYWARLRSFGMPDSVIADHNPEPGERARVVVSRSDRGFKVSNGCTWLREQTD